MRSLAARTAQWLLPLLALGLALNGVLAWRETRGNADRLADQTLLLRLSLLADWAASVAQGPDGAWPPAPALALAHSEVAGVPERLYAVLDERQFCLAGSNDLPLPRLAGPQPQVLDARYQDRVVRVAVVVIDSPLGPLKVAMIEDATPRAAWARAALWSELQRQAVLVAVLLGAAWWLRRQGLQAVDQVRARIANRAAEDLSPLNPNDFAPEWHPMTEALNAHLARLAALLEASRRFAADVAHQLRTPLALLGAQAQYGLRQQDPAEMRRMVEGMVAATRKAQRLCNQMLTLSRLEAGRGLLRDAVALDLGTLVRETALDLGVLALDRQIDLAYEQSAPALAVRGHEVMLRELFSNVIDNALRYTPRGGQVRIAVDAAGAGQARVRISDSGPASRPRRARPCSAAFTVASTRAARRAVAWAWPSCTRSAPPTAAASPWAASRARA